MVKKTQTSNPIQLNLETQLAKAKSHMAGLFPEFAKKINAMKVQATWNCSYGAAVAWTAGNCIWFSANYGKYRIVSEMDEEMGRMVFWIAPPSARSKALNLLNYRTKPTAQRSDVSLHLTDYQQSTLTVAQRKDILNERCQQLNGKLTDKVGLADAFYVESVLRHEIAHLISRQFIGQKVQKFNTATGAQVMRIMNGKKDANGKRLEVPFFWTLKNNYSTHTSDIWLYTITEWARRSNIPFFSYSEIAELRALVVKQNENYEHIYAEQRTALFSTTSHFLFNINKATAKEITTYFREFAKSVIERNEQGKRTRTGKSHEKVCLHCAKVFIAKRSSTQFCQDVWRNQKVVKSCRVDYKAQQAKLARRESKS